MPATSVDTSVPTDPVLENIHTRARNVRVVHDRRVREAVDEEDERDVVDTGGWRSRLPGPGAQANW